MLKLLNDVTKHSIYQPLRGRAVLTGNEDQTEHHEASIYDTLYDAATSVPQKTCFDSGQSIDKYKVVALLGQGAFGSVYRCHDAFADREVAVKVLRSDSVLMTGREEARAISKFKHPQIAALLDHGEIDNGCKFLVFEFLEVKTLDHLLNANEKLHLDQAIEFLISICAPLKLVHKYGWTHRDLKPANIVIDKSGEASLLDFGLAVSETEAAKQMGQVAGTAAFMSPEQASGNTQLVDGRTDIWALGAIFYRMLTGKMPFQNFDQIRSGVHRPASMREPTLGKQIDQVFKKFFATQIDQRFSSISAVEESLRALKGEASVSQQNSQSKTTLVTAIAVVGCLIFAFVAHSIFRSSNDPKPQTNSNELVRSNALQLASWVIDHGGSLDGDFKDGRSWDPITEQDIAAGTDFEVLQIDLSQVNCTDDLLLEMMQFKSVGTLETLDLEGARVTDKGIAGLKGLRRLSSLNLTAMDVTDKTLVFIRDHLSLNDLDLEETTTSDSGVEIISEMNLQFLDLSECRGVTDRSVPFLTKMKLETLDLTNTSITKEALEKSGLK